MELVRYSQISLRRREWLRRLQTGFACSFLLCGLLISYAWGQGTSYLTGFVTDASGAVVTNATVIVTDESTGTQYELKTTDTGVYRSPTLPPSTYDIDVKAPGFQETITKGVQLLVGTPRSVDVSLTVGAITQSVEVNAGAPLLKTEDAGLGQSVQPQEISGLPYFNRSAGVLLSLAPTVRYTGEDVISYGASRYNVGGFTNVNVMVDGASVNGDREDVSQMVLNPSVEAIREVKIATNQYSAQFGKDLGGLVQMESKSGTNQYHGGVYYYFRNEVLDAVSAFSHTKPVDRQEMPGGTIGGPIKKDKLFFFSAFETQLAISPLGVSLTVPTSAERNGDFSQLPQKIYNPATTTTDPVTGKVTRIPFAGNVIPTTMFDPSAVKALAYIPQPSIPGVLTNNLPSSTGTNLTKYRGVNRIDWNIGSKDQFYFDYIFDHTLNTNLGVPAYNMLSPAASPTLAGFGFQFFTQSYNFSEFHTFSPSFFMSNRFLYRPRDIERVNPAVDPAAMWASKLGINNYAGERLPASLGGDLGFPSYNFSGYTSLGPGFLLFQEKPIKEYSYDLDLTYVHGAHSLKFGFQTEYGQHGAPDQSWPTGIFSFTPTETGLPSAASSGDAFASFLLGQVDNGTTVLGPPLIWHNWYYGAYVQDDWKVRRNLTLNLGLRWDIDAPVYESQYRGNGFNFNAINPVSGTPGIVNFFNAPGGPVGGFYNIDWHRFAPRFGFAYQAVPQTVIRGGYGIFNINPNLGANTRAPSLGYTTVGQFNSPDGGVTPAFILANGFPNYPLGGDPSVLNASFGAVPVGTPPTTTPTFVNPRWKFGYVQNFNLSIQRQLPFNMLIEIAGQASLARNLPIQVNWNEVPPQFWGLTGNNYVHRPFPQYNNVTEVKNAEGTQNYWNGYVRLEKRFSKGLTLTSNYSLGKSLGFLGGSIYFPRLSYGPAIYNEANGVTAVPYQMATISWAYDLPWGHGQRWLNSGWVSYVLGGWSIGGVLSWNGGVPFGVTCSCDSLNGNSPLGNRVNIVGNPNLSNPTPSLWFNTAAFAAPPFGTIGNYGGTLLGPSNTRLDFTLRKMFSLTEHVKFTLLGEFFNFTNTPQFGPPDSNLGDPTFGQTNGPGPGLGANTLGPYGARQIQLGGRIDF
jgi:Carboxypeptidase regulatory-like domain